MKTKRCSHMFLMLTLLLAAVFAVQPATAEDPPAETPPVEEKLLFEDDFQLENSWSWLREDSDAWRLKDNALEIRVQPGVADTVKNALVREAPDRSKGRYAIDITITNNTTPSQQYEQAGITWYSGGKPVVKVVKELVNGKVVVVPGLKLLTENKVQLRLIVDADSWTALYRPEVKGEYLPAGKGKLPPPDNDQVSIQCYNGPPEAEHWIRFDDFRIVKMSEPVSLWIDTADVVAIAKQTEGIFEAVKDNSLFDFEKITAFEENARFVYILGDASPACRGGVRLPGKSHPWVIRRVIFIKPSTVVVDDCLEGYHWESGPGTTPVHLGLNVAEGETIPARQFAAIWTSAWKKEILWQDFAKKGPGDNSGRKPWLVQPASEGRFVSVFHIPNDDNKAAKTDSKLVREKGRLELTASDGNQTSRLSLPPVRPSGDSAEDCRVKIRHWRSYQLRPVYIEIAKADGEQLLKRRPLPAGVMPHGAEGMKLLARWDSAYHNDKRPGWDTGRTATELKKLIDEKREDPDRTPFGDKALVIGCGTGTNAIYLAKEGFVTTGLDLAPTALSRAAEKAKKADVEVNWTLADATAPPEMGTFDFIFDRGCYHGVRRSNAKGYVESVKQLTHPGSRILILAGNANEEKHYGPPRVKEEDIRADFEKDFEIESLSETRFDSSNTTAKGPLAWAILLKRKDTK